MANTIIKAEQVVAQFIGLLQRELVLPRLMTPVAERDFIGAKGDTVNLRMPSVFKARTQSWRTRSGAISTDELNEISVPIELDTHLYHAVGVTDEELTLDIRDWGAQIAQPQAQAIAEGFEDIAAAAMINGDYEADPLDVAGFTSFHSAAVEARRLLNKQNVPTSGRFIVLGSDLEADVLNDTTLVPVDTSGSDSVLREAVVGRVAGFTVIGGVNALPGDVGFAFHTSAYGVANVAPVVPEGASAGASLSTAGLAMRWIRDYDADYLRDRSVFSAFAGAASVEDGRVIDEDASDWGDETGKNVRAVKLVSSVTSS